MSGKTPNMLTETSKTSRKREMEQIFNSIEKILKLSPQQIKQLSFDADIIEELLRTSVMPANSTRSRQVARIRKLLQMYDDQFSSAVIHAELLRLTHTGQEQFHLQTLATHWFDKLTKDDPSAVNEWLEQFPDSDTQQLRSLIRSHIKQAKEKGAVSSKKLFQFVLQHLQQS